MSSSEQRIQRYADGSLRFIGDKTPHKLNIVFTNPLAENLAKGDDPEDPAFDLYAISREAERPEDRVDDINIFETGIVITPPSGCMCIVIEEDSLQQQFGYRLSPSVLYIPPGNTKELKIPLYKFRDTEEDLQLPHKIARLIPLEVANAVICLPDKKQAPRGDMGYNQYQGGGYPRGYEDDRRGGGGRGAYQFQDPHASAPGNMDAYNRQVNKLPPGARRPVAAPRNPW